MAAKWRTGLVVLLVLAVGTAARNVLAMAAPPWMRDSTEALVVLFFTTIAATLVAGRARPPLGDPALGLGPRLFVRIASVALAVVAFETLIASFEGLARLVGLSADARILWRLGRGFALGVVAASFAFATGPELVVRTRPASPRGTFVAALAAATIAAASVPVAFVMASYTVAILQSGSLVGALTTLRSEIGQIGLPDAGVLTFAALAPLTVAFRLRRATLLETTLAGFALAFGVATARAALAPTLVTDSPWPNGATAFSHHLEAVIVLGSWVGYFPILVPLGCLLGDRLERRIESALAASSSDPAQSPPEPQPAPRGERLATLAGAAGVLLGCVALAARATNQTYLLTHGAPMTAPQHAAATALLGTAVALGLAALVARSPRARRVPANATVLLGGCGLGVYVSVLTTLGTELAHEELGAIESLGSRPESGGAIACLLVLPWVVALGVVGVLGASERTWPARFVVVAVAVAAFGAGCVVGFGAL